MYSEVLKWIENVHTPPISIHPHRTCVCVYVFLLLFVMKYYYVGHFVCFFWKGNSSDSAFTYCVKFSKLIVY